MSVPQDDFDLELEDATKTTKETKTKETSDDTKELPDKFQGKSPEQLVEMYSNLERLNSRQAQELGEYRKKVDEILGLRERKDNTQPQKKPVTTTDLLQSPDEVLSRVIASSDVATQAKEAVSRVQDLEAQLAQQTFVSKYPKFREDVGDPNFLSWVATNDLRRNLAQRADKNDYNAATALWDLWDEHKALVGNKAAEEEENKKKAALKGVRSVKNGASAETKAKPTFSRQKLIDLQMRAEGGDARALAKWNDPAFKSAREEAYREGRVK